MTGLNKRTWTAAVLAVAYCGSANAAVDETWAWAQLQYEYWYGEAACPSPLPYIQCRSDFYYLRGDLWRISAANWAQSDPDKSETHKFVSDWLLNRSVEILFE
jgi:hypothetical protein